MTAVLVRRAVAAAENSGRHHLSGPTVKAELIASLGSALTAAPHTSPDHRGFKRSQT